jgi:hypothetical protein
LTWHQQQYVPSTHSVCSSACLAGCLARRYTGTLSYLPATASAPPAATAAGTAEDEEEEEEEEETSAAAMAAGPAPSESPSPSPSPTSRDQLKRLLPASLEAPVPSEWKTETGETVLFWACNTAWASFESPQTPAAKLSDGCWQLLTISGDNPKLSFCEVLNVAEDPAVRRTVHTTRLCID